MPNRNNSLLGARSPPINFLMDREHLPREELLEGMDLAGDRSRLAPQLHSTEQPGSPDLYFSLPFMMAPAGVPANLLGRGGAALARTMAGVIPMGPPSAPDQPRGTFSEADDRRYALERHRRNPLRGAPRSDLDDMVYNEPMSIGNFNALMLGGGLGTAGHFFLRSRLPNWLRATMGVGGMEAARRGGQGLWNDYGAMTNAVSAADEIEWRKRLDREVGF